jgi:hypothetical protein
MMIDMADDALYDIHEAELTAIHDMPEVGIKKGDKFKAEIWVYPPDTVVFIKRLPDGKVLRDIRKNQAS